MKLNSIFLLISLSLSAPTFSADSNGKFSVKGAGKRSCENFIKASNTKGTDYYLYGGWLEGYLSSYNQFQEKNFDISPWQTTELMLALLKKQCSSHPDTKFLSAVNSLIKTLFPIRLNSESNLVKIQVGKSESYYYQEIIQRAKKRLQKLGYIKGQLQSGFTKNDALAFEKFQKAIGLPATGIPDQRTLLSLFIKTTSK